MSIDDPRETYQGEPSGLGSQGEDADATLIVMAGANVGACFGLGEDVTIIGRDEAAGVHVSDHGVSREHCKIVVDAASISGFSLYDLDSRNGTFVNGEKVQNSALVDGDRIHLGTSTILRFSISDQLEQTFQQQMIESMLRDPLTHAYNARYFEERLESEFRYSSRHEASLALIFFSLDDRESVEKRGAVALDVALKTVAGYVHGTIRSEDVLARTQHSDFALILRGITSSDSLVLAARIRDAIASLPISTTQANFHVSVCMGIAAYPEHTPQDPVALIAAAEEALNSARETGPGEIGIFQALPPDQAE